MLSMPAAAAPTSSDPSVPVVPHLTDEPVEVRTEPRDGGEQPGQFLRRGRLWLVRHAVRLACRSGQAERWRVQAGDGADGHPVVLELVRLRAGGWQLHEEGA